MRFLKDRECKNGINHSTQEDCRAKAPIHISNNIRWDLIFGIILAFVIFFGFLGVKFDESFAFTLLAVIVGMMIIIISPSVVLRGRHSSKVPLLTLLFLSPLSPLHFTIISITATLPPRITATT